MGTVTETFTYLSERGFSPARVGYAQRVVPHPIKRKPTDTLGPPWWHYINRVGTTGAGYFQACANHRGPESARDWVSPWFDTVEACYLYAELNQWGM